MCNTTRLNPNPHEDKTHEGHIALREEDVKKFFLDTMIFFHDGCVSPPKKAFVARRPDNRKKKNDDQVIPYIAVNKRDNWTLPRTSRGGSTPEEN